MGLVGYFLKEMKKQLLLFVLMMLPLVASAYDFEVDGYRYTVITSSTAEFSGVNPNFEGEVVIPEFVLYSGKQLSVNVIGERAFESYKSSFLRIPSHIEKIENAAFYKAQIDSLHFEYSEKPINLANTINRGPSMSYSMLGSVYIGRQINRTDYNSNADGPFYMSYVKKVYIGKTCDLVQELFQNCSQLESVIVSEGSVITSISSECFRNCSKLMHIDLKKGLTSIGSLAFYQCTSLDSIYIPSTVKTISSNAFSEAKNIKKVVSASEDPISIDGTAFPGIVYLSSTLYVPSGTKSKYEITQGWKEFANIVEDGQKTSEQEIKKCATPIITFVDNKLTFSSETEDAEYVATISDTDIKTHYGNEISLTATYNISVYALKTGYEKSDIATATLCWIDQQPKTEGITDGVVEVRARAVLINSYGGLLTVEGINDGQIVDIYSLNGEKRGSAVSKNGVACIDTNVHPGSVVVVKIGNKSVKVIVK